MTAQLPFLPKVLQIKTPRLLKQEYRLLDGSCVQLVAKVGDGSITCRFDKTPLPVRQADVVCPHFLELKWAYGCPFNCAWCYLKGTFRFQPHGTKPVCKNRDKVTGHVTAFLQSDSVPEILNTGELADSLMSEDSAEPFSRSIIPLFESQGKHKVLFVTKSDSIDELLNIEPHRNVIVSFSLNAKIVASKWEKGAPSVSRRIEAGHKLAQAGYEIRVRIDPMVPVDGWEKHYHALTTEIFDAFTPSRITLGSLRGLQSTINQSKDKSWILYLKENSNWGKKVDSQTRYHMYSSIIQFLRNTYGYGTIALCKETVDMWGKLGMDYSKIKCNCVW